MANYKVLVIALTVKNNKIANYGDIVDDSQLNSSAFDLIKDGFLEVVVEDSKASAKAEKPKASAKAEKPKASAKESETEEVATDSTEAKK